MQQNAGQDFVEDCFTSNDASVSVLSRALNLSEAYLVMFLGGMSR